MCSHIEYEETYLLKATVVEQSEYVVDLEYKKVRFMIQFSSNTIRNI